MVLTLIRDLLGAPGLLATVRDNALARIALDTSIGVSGPRDFTSASAAFVRATKRDDALASTALPVQRFVTTRTSLIRTGTWAEYT